MWGGIEVNMGVCFKLLDAVSGSWGWNTRKRGFLCSACLSTLQGRSSEDWKISFAPGLDKAGLGYVGFSGSCFPRLTGSGAICCVLGPRTSDPFMGSQWNISPSHSSVYASAFDLFLDSQEPSRSHCSSTTSIYARPVFFLCPCWD